MTGTVSDRVGVAEIVDELRAMLAVSERHPTLARRLFGQRLRVRYEFLTGDPVTGEGSAEPVPYLMAIAAEGASVAPAEPDDTDADIVIRATPQTLHRVINGDLGGREAMASGLLDIRKAPSMPKLLLMRALFNGYKKARQRGELGQPAGVVAGEADPVDGPAAESADTCGVAALVVVEPSASPSDGQPAPLPAERPGPRSAGERAGLGSAGERPGLGSAGERPGLGSAAERPGPGSAGERPGPGSGGRG